MGRHHKRHTRQLYPTRPVQPLRRPRPHRPRDLGPQPRPQRGIAISFGSKDEQPIEVIRAAARLAVRVVNHLYQNWDKRVELYNLNVPMRADVETRPVRYTRTLPYYWSKGCLYAEVSQANGHSAPGLTNGNSNHSDENGAKLCNGSATKALNGFGGSHLKKRNFAWSAELSEMKKALQASEEGTDAHTVLNGSTRLACSIIFRPLDGTPRLQADHEYSVTPLTANFSHVSGLDGPLELDD
jgi:hypothetical protein